MICHLILLIQVAPYSILRFEHTFNIMQHENISSKLSLSCAANAANFKEDPEEMFL